jgi:Ankyrin repeats (3 copies)
MKFLVKAMHTIVGAIIPLLLLLIPISVVVRLIAALRYPGVRLSITRHPIAHLVWLAAAIAVIVLALFLPRPSPVQRLSGAAMQGDLELLKKLDANGVSLDSPNVYAHGWTPLMAAIYMQQTNIIQYLLTQNLNLNIKDPMGRTALMWAITVDDTNTVRLLLEKGAALSGDAFQYVNLTNGNARTHRELYLEWLTAYKDKNKSTAKP